MPCIECRLANPRRGRGEVRAADGGDLVMISPSQTISVCNDSWCPPPPGMATTTTSQTIIFTTTSAVIRGLAVHGLYSSLECRGMFCRVGSSPLRGTGLDRVSWVVMASRFLASHYAARWVGNRSLGRLGGRWLTRQCLAYAVHSLQPYGGGDRARTGRRLLLPPGHPHGSCCCY